MARKKSKRRSWKETPSKEKVGTDLINGRSMMAVCLLYEELEFPKREGRGTSYVQKLLRDYKEHQDRVRECLPSCYEVLEENRRARKDPFDPELLAQVKRIIEDEMGYIWDKKTRPPAKRKVVIADRDEYDDTPEEPEPEEELEEELEEEPELPAYEPPEEEPPESPEEEVDWAARFSDGEFDLEEE